MLKTILANPHTTFPGLIILACGLGEIWFPKYTEQFHRTRELAAAYGFLLAGDALRKAKNGGTGGTDFLSKQAATPIENKP